MALGALTVSLGLDAAEFISGLTKSEAAAKKFGQQMDRAIAVGIVKAQLALEAFGAAAKATARVFESLTEGAAKFQDLAETTGAAAEDLAGFAVAAATAGVSVEDVAGSMIKLTKNLTGVDDESKDAGAAIKALGLDVAKFKQLDPAAQYEAIGKALSGFADGAGKTAVAVAIFGKAGAEQLKVFKALEEQGGRTNILTKEQIALSDDYKDKQAKATAELKLYAQAAVIDLLPALTAVTKEVGAFIRELVGLDGTVNKLTGNSKLKDWAQQAQELFGGKRSSQSLVDEIGDLEANITRIKGIKSDGALFSWLYGSEAERDKELATLTKQLRAAQKLLIERNANLTGERLTSFTDPRSALFGKKEKPDVDFEGAKKAAAAKAARPPVDEAQRYLESLERQLQGVEDLTAAQKVMADAESGRLKFTKDITEARVLGIALEIDARREQKQIEAEIADITRKNEEDKNRAILQNSQAQKDYINSLLSGTPTKVFEEQQKAIEALREEFYKGETGLIPSVKLYEEAIKKVMGNTTEDTKEAKSAAEELGMTFASAFEDAVIGGKSLSEVLKSLDKDIARILLRKLVTEPLAEGLTAGIKSGTGGGGFGDIFAAFLKGASGNAMGGPIGANSLSRVAERGPETFSDGSSTYLLTGNRGGYIDPKPGGGSAQPIVVNVQMPPGGNRETALQWGEAAGRQLRLSMSRNG